MLGECLMSRCLEAEMQRWVPDAQGKRRGVTVHTKNGGGMVSRRPGDGAQEVDAIRAKKMVDDPGELPFHIPVHPKECLLEQLASCQKVHIKCPVEVASNALEIPQIVSRAMQSKVLNSHDELELGLF